MSYSDSANEFSRSKLLEEIMPEATSSVLQASYSPKAFKGIVTDFMAKLNFTPPALNDVPDIKQTKTFQSLCSTLSPFNEGNGWFEPACLLAAAFAEFPYPSHSAEVKLQIAMFTWYLLYFDDFGNRIPSDLQTFQMSLFTNQRYDNPILQSFRQHLAEFYDLWDPIGANCITAAGVEFINGRLIEEEPSICNMAVRPIAVSWPNFLRVKTGAAAAYTFFLFPKAEFPDISTYIQIVDDIVFFTNHINDLLSYHKEAVTGDTNNYIHARALVNRKTVSETLQDVANDLLAVNVRVTQALENTIGEEIWKLFVIGQINFHFAIKRYRLEELEF